MPPPLGSRGQLRGNGLKGIQGTGAGQTLQRPKASSAGQRNSAEKQRISSAAFATTSYGLPDLASRPVDPQAALSLLPVLQVS